MQQVDLPEYAADLWQPFRHLAWHGGRGPGKTRTVATGLILQSMERHERVLCGRETQRSIRDSSKRVLDDEIDRLAVRSVFTSTETEIAAAITRVEGGPGGSSAGVPGATTGGGTRVIAQGAPKQGGAPSGYRWNASGTELEPIPGGPATRSNNAPGSVNRKAEADLRRQFDALPEVKRFKGIRAAREQVRAIVTKKEASAQDDIALIFAYMKMLDPDSVVREGEFAMAQNATGVPDQVRNQYNKVLDGTRLNADQRRNIAGLVERLYKPEREAYNSAAETYRGYTTDPTTQPGDIWFKPNG